MAHRARLTDLLLNRRELLARCGTGLGSLALTTLLAGESAADVASENPLAPRAPHFAPRAKRVIHFFLNGGASQVDTLDPKPMLDRYHGQPLPSGTLKTERKTGAAYRSPFKFGKYGQSGIEMSEIFPKLSQHADDLCVVRSMHADVPNHEPSLMLLNCGSPQQERPSMGSWILYGLGTENQNLPGFVVMCPGGYPIKQGSNWRSAFLPGIYQGTFVDPENTRIDKLLENIRSTGLSPERQRAQLDLVQALNRRHLTARGADSQLEARIQSMELAYRMQAEATDAFDIGREPAHVRERYGSGVHGRQTLIARRLLERGVRYVQLWHGEGQPWDNHTDIEKNHRRLAQQLDGPVAALLQDLKERGMLEDTLVLCSGEFGRTPVVELQPGASGRDHNHWGFSLWMAGGGVRAGTTYGATDEFGFRAVENPVHIYDLQATMLKLLGFDHEKLTYRYAGRDFRLTDIHGQVVPELLA